jgi:hypothetical protein
MEASMKICKPRTSEDKLFYKYWNESKDDLFLEVPIGNKGLSNWPPGSKIRRIDGVLLKNNLDENNKVYPYNDYTIEDFNGKTKGNLIELIEVKIKLN